MPGRAVAAVLAGSAAVLATSQALADPSDRFNSPGFAFGSAGGEAIVGTLSVAALTTYFLPQRQTSWDPYSYVEREVHYDAASNFTGAVFGAMFVTTNSYVLESVYLAHGHVKAPGVRAMRNLITEAEALAFSTGLTTALKRITGRCRPRSWKESKCGTLDTDHDAFPSGHTMTVGSLAGTQLSFALRTGADPAPRWIAFGVAEAATVATAMLRVLAGAHSWSDVLGGFAVGHAAGFALGYAHPMVDPPLRTEAPQAIGTTSAPATLSIAGSF